MSTEEASQIVDVHNRSEGGRSGGESGEEAIVEAQREAEEVETRVGAVI